MKLLAAFSRPGQSASATATRALDAIEADLAAMPDRIKTAQAALANLADLSADEHAAADAELASLRRTEARLHAQAAKAKEALAIAREDEAADALAARCQAAKKLLTAYGKLLGRYEQEAAKLAATVAEMQAIEDEIAAVNRDITAAMRNKPNRAHPPLVATPDAIYRSEPDIVEADRTVTEERVMRSVAVLRPESDEEGGDRLVLEEQRWEGVRLTRKDAAGKYILGPGEAVRKVERVIPGRRTPGRRISSPTSELVLPPARVGQPKLWPRT